MTTAIRVKFIGQGVIRVFEKDSSGNPIGTGLTIKTAIDFLAAYKKGIAALAELVETVIRANLRIVKRLLGGRLK